MIYSLGAAVGSGVVVESGMLEGKWGLGRKSRVTQDPTLG